MALAKNIIKAGGDLYYSTDYNSASGLISTLDGTNGTAVKAQMDALTFATVGKIAGFSISHAQENENTNYAMNCSVGSFLATADKKANVTATLLELNNIDVMSKILGSTKEVVAGTPVTGQAYSKTSGSWSYNVPFVLPYKNANGTAITVTSLTGSVDGLLVANTDYFVGVNSNGETTITIIDSTTITTQSQNMNFVLAFTPSVATLNSYNFENADIPFGLYKFVSCPYLVNSSEISDPAKPRRRDYIYVAKAKLGGEVVERYLNIGENLEGAEVTLNGELGGLYMKYIAEGATKASV